jgi:hypothetical protein
MGMRDGLFGWRFGIVQSDYVFDGISSGLGGFSVKIGLALTS